MTATNVAMPATLPRWGSLVQWTPLTWYVLGERIYGLSGNVYTVTTPGLSAGSGGPTGVGAGIMDGSVVWTGVAFSTVWSNNSGAGTVYAAGARTSNAGNLYQAIVGGTGSTTTGPTATVTPPGGIVDGTVRWIYLSAAFATDTEPLEQQKDVGWVPGQQPPAQYLNWLLFTIYRWLIWLQSIASQAFTWTAAHVFQAGITVTQSVVDTLAITGVGNGTGEGVLGVGGSNGIGVTGRGKASKPGVQGNADGTGSGVEGNGGTGGAGVRGYAGTNAAGVYGTSADTVFGGVDGRNAGAGPGVYGSSSTGTGIYGAGGSVAGVHGESTTGTGGEFKANATQGAILLIPQASAPSNPSVGQIYCNTTGPHFYVCLVANTWTLLV